MKKWWNRKKRENKKSDDHYTLLDFILDVVFMIPELIILPFRIMIWLLRGLGRLIGNVFDIV